MPDEQLFGVGIPQQMREAQQRENVRALELVRHPDSVLSREYMREIELRIAARLEREDPWLLTERAVFARMAGFDG